MTDATPTRIVSPEDAAALMRWANLPLDPNRAPGLADRLSQSRAEPRLLDCFVDRTTEPLGLYIPRGE
jgi:hypothetical protein